MSENEISRREFLKRSSAAAVAGPLLMNVPALSAPPEEKPRVILIRNESVLDSSGEPVRDVLAGMLDRAVTSLVGKQDAVSAWKQIVSPEDIVGIKTNVWRYLPTPPALESLIRERVLEAGVAKENIGTRDRGLYEDDLFLKATALINVRPLRTHHWSGVGSLLKNYITFVPKPWEYHDDSCADLGALWKLPAISGRTRLNVLVMLTPQFHGVGPHSYNPKYTWPYAGLLVGFDPVAVDATGVRILQEKRNLYFGEKRPINPPPKHIEYADTRHGQGVSNKHEIELQRHGWEQDRLI